MTDRHDDELKNDADKHRDDAGEDEGSAPKEGKDDPPKRRSETYHPLTSALCSPARWRRSDPEKCPRSSAWRLFHQSGGAQCVFDHRADALSRVRWIRLDPPTI